MPAPIPKNELGEGPVHPKTPPFDISLPLNATQSESLVRQTFKALAEHGLMFLGTRATRGVALGSAAGEYSG